MACPEHFPLRAREPRIKVAAPARLRVGIRWSDACILNVSARGLLVHAPEPPERGSYVELRRGDQVVIGRVVWRSGSRVGLQAQDPVPVGSMVTSKAAQPMQGGGPGAARERRRCPRAHERSRLRGRAFEFASISAIAATLSVAMFSIVAQAVASPLAKVRTGLDGQASLPADSR
ncbi:PilZ domain-containing protein [Sphingomonas sp. F9_3S_D5_B_2]